jgi:predicted nuclease of predicted toxin-antitoxin system
MAKISFYFDEMMVRKAAEQLILRGYTVVMAVDVGMMEKDDDTEHLSYAAAHNLVVVTFDRSFAGRTMKRTDHLGLVCLSGAQDNIGSIVRTLSEFAQRHVSENVAGRVFWM